LIWSEESVIIAAMDKKTGLSERRIDATGPAERWSGQAADILRGGGVVAFPTETVYGLAACPSIDGALRKLDALKGRPSDKPYTVLIAYPSQLKEYISAPPWPARVLARKGWPGPITMVIEVPAEQLAHARERFGPDCDKLFSNNRIGLRCPDHPVARALLAASPSAVVAPSANPADKPPACDADEVCRYFPDEQIDLILDAGPTRYRKSSTVVSIAGNDVKVLRTGPIDAEAIDRLVRFNIVFVCTGNTCRSPMAEALCRQAFTEMLSCSEAQLEDFKITITSAGAFAGSGMPASGEAIEAMKAFSIDLTGHRSKPVTADLINRADVIYAMTPEHRNFICELVPGATSRVELLDRQAAIADPLGSTVDIYADCANRLRRLIQERLRELF